MRVVGGAAIAAAMVVSACNMPFAPSGGGGGSSGTPSGSSGGAGTGVGGMPGGGAAPSAPAAPTPPPSAPPPNPVDLSTFVVGAWTPEQGNCNLNMVFRDDGVIINGLTPEARARADGGRWSIRTDGAQAYLHIVDQGQSDDFGVERAGDRLVLLMPNGGRRLELHRC